MDGFLIIDKPTGITSHDVVNFVRGRFKMRRVGHAGTLDPMATGVLIILVGKWTKFFSHFSNFDKEYLVTASFAAVTSTGDAEGKILKEFDYSHVSIVDVKATFSKFKGNIEQVPPMVSAIKKGGKRLYELARNGIELKRQARPIFIKEIELLKFYPPLIDFKVNCSKGTYIRSLCEDVGRSLGCGGYETSLRRTRVGEFSIEQALHLEKINESHIRQ
ncbi:MAG: tRNA pseudouridine(55) synthase TruB [Candidatus Omnitrophica bacterium]|nr:tRNA pseudouridine(55) synthase TruB [Candidatus Omnitrophota bacterium]